MVQHDLGVHLTNDFEPILPEGYALSPDGVTTYGGDTALPVWLYWDPRDCALVWDDPAAGEQQRPSLDAPDGVPVMDFVRFQLFADGGPVELGLGQVLDAYLDVRPVPVDFAKAYRDWTRGQAVRPARRGWIDGATFIRDVPPDPQPLWGAGSRVAHAPEEGTIIVGPVGVGKTTLAQQYVLRRLGVGEPELLGLPVAPAELGVVYLAMDRPAQIARSFRRMVSPDDYEALDGRLHVWQGALPFDLLKSDPRRLAEWVHERFGPVDEVVVDSYKDLGLNLVSDEGGARLNDVMQATLSEGVDWLGLHHGRKANGDNRQPNGIDDIYGSRWITAGVGSALMLWGDAGGDTSTLAHLKQPAEPVGTVSILHDRAGGTVEAIDVGTATGRQADRHAAILHTFRDGAPLAFEAFAGLAERFGTTDKTIRRDLAALVDEGRLIADGDTKARTYKAVYLS